MASKSRSTLERRRLPWLNWLWRPKTAQNDNLSNTPSNVVGVAPPHARHTTSDDVDKNHVDPPSERQASYIRILGGDPREAATKDAAADLIARLRRHQGPTPLDPYELEKRGNRAGVDAGADWKSAYYGMLAGLRLDLQKYVNSTLDSLRAQIGNTFGSGGATQDFVPRRLVGEAHIYLERLRVWSTHQANTGEPMPNLVTNHHSVFSGPLGIFAVSDPLSSGRPSDVAANDVDLDWSGLIAILAICVVIESFLNLPLLLEGLEAGMLQAFTLAVLISLINVGGIGIGGGILLRLANARSAMSRFLFPSTWGLWIAVAAGFNTIAGRHRESYARRMEMIQEDPTQNVPPAAELLDSVSWNLLSWNIQALLFALLGFILCAIGCAKGFHFLKGPHHEQSWFRFSVLPHRTPQNEDSIASIYANVLDRFLGGVAETQRIVADWYEVLDQRRRDIVNTVNMVAQEENRSACIDIVDQAFIFAYNNMYTNKIHLSDVRAHREKKYPTAILVAPSDEGIISESTEIITQWRQDGRFDFESRCEKAKSDVIDLWRNYEPLILNDGRHAS